MKDDEFGDDIEFDFDKITDDRNPSIAIPEDVIKGTLDGLREDKFSEQAKEVAGEAIPAVGLGDKYYELSKAKRSIDKSIRDSVTDIQLQAKPIIDVLKDVIPEKSFLRKYLRHAEDGSSSGGSLEEDAYDSSEFFKQAKEQKDLLLETTSAQVASQDKGTNRIVSMLNITNEYNLSYYKKSLEYQYRLLGETTKSNKTHSALLVDSLNLLRSINKNVALPDFVKLKTSEAVKATLRERLVGKLFDTDSIKSLSDVIGSNFQNYLQAKIATSSSFIEGASEVAGMGNMLSDSISDDDLKEMGTTRARFLASSLAPRLLREYGGRKLGEYINKLPGMSKYTERVNDAFDNSQETAYNIRTKLEEKGMFKRAGIVGFIEQMLSDNNSSSNDFTSFVDSPDETRLFDTRVYDSVTKVIPKYLADIVSLLGGTQETYDFGSGKFIKKDVSSLEVGFRQPLETSGEMDVLRTLKDKGFTTDEVIEIARVAKIMSMPLSTTNVDKSDLDDSLKEKISKIKEHADIKSFNTISKVIRKDGLKYGDRIEEYYKSGMGDELLKAGIIKEDALSGEMFTDEAGLNDFVLKQYKALLDNEKLTREAKPEEKRQLALIKEELRRTALREEQKKKDEKERDERIVKRRLEDSEPESESKSPFRIKRYKKSLKEKKITKREIAEDKARQALKEVKDVKAKLESLYDTVKQRDDVITALQKVKEDIGISKHDYKFTTENPNKHILVQNPLPPKRNLIDTATGYVNSIKNTASNLYSKLPSNTKDVSKFKFTVDKPDNLNTLQPVEKDKSIFDVLSEIKDNLITGNKESKEAMGLMNDLQSFNVFGIATRGKKTFGSLLDYAKQKVTDKTPQFVKDKLGQGKKYVGSKVDEAKTKVVDTVKDGLGIKPKPANNTEFNGKPNPVLSTLEAIKQRLTPEDDEDGNEKSIIGKLIQTVKPKEVRKGSYKDIYGKRTTKLSASNNTNFHGSNNNDNGGSNNGSLTGKLVGGLFGTIKDTFLSGGMLTKLLMGVGASGLYGMFKGLINGDKDLDVGDRITDYMLDSITPDWLKSASDEKKEAVKDSIRKRHDTSHVEYTRSTAGRSRYTSHIEHTQSNVSRGRYTNASTTQSTGKIDSLDKALLSRIAMGEVNTASKSGYDEIIGFGKYGRPPKQLTKMTIAEVITFQRKLLANGSPSTAVGRYQFLKRTLLEEVKDTGIPMSTIFSPEIQDMLILNRLKRMRGYKAYRSGKLKQDDFIRNLSQEFASIENPYTHRGFYKGQNVHTTAKQLKDVLSGKVTAGQLMLQKPNKKTTSITQSEQTFGNAQLNGLSSLAGDLSSFFGSPLTAIKGGKSIIDAIPSSVSNTAKANKQTETNTHTIEASIDTSNLEHAQGKTVDGITKQTKEISTQTSVVKENVNVNKEMLSELKKLNKNIINTNPRAHRGKYKQPEPIYPVN